MEAVAGKKSERIEALTDATESRSGSKKINGLDALDKNARKIGKLLSKKVFVHALFGALDGGIIAYSTFKYGFDLCCPPSISSSDVMHNWLNTPGGIALGIIESLSIITLSIIGNAIDEDDPGYKLVLVPSGEIAKPTFSPAKRGIYLEPVLDCNGGVSELNYVLLNSRGKKYTGTITREQLDYYKIDSCSLTDLNALLPIILEITEKNGHAVDKRKSLVSRLSWFWPYFRDAFKGLKFAYKGLRSTLQMINTFGVDFRSILVPAGLILGIVALLNRIWNRNMVTNRKAAKQVNVDLYEKAMLLGEYGLVEDALPPPIAHTIKDRIYLQIGEQGLHYTVYEANGNQRKGTILFQTLMYNKKHRNGTYIKPTLEALSNDYKTSILWAIKREVPNLYPLLNENTEEARNSIKAQLRSQTSSAKAMGYASAVYGGLIDGLYTYMGLLAVVAVGSLSAPLTIVVAATCVLFTLINVITRCYEEYDYQNDLIQTELNTRLVIIQKEMQSIFAQLQNAAEANLLEKKSIGKDDKAAKHAEIERLTNALQEKLNELEGTRTKLQALVKRSYFGAVLSGLRASQYAYSAISSILFATVSVYLIMAVPFPPIIMLTAVCIGLLSLLFFVSFFLYKHAKQIDPIREKSLDEFQTLNKQSLGQFINQFKFANGMTPLLGDQNLPEDEQKLIEDEQRLTMQEQLKEGVRRGMVVDPLPQYHFQEWAEVVRSSFSAIAKGPKGVEYVFNSFQEQNGETGHFQDTPWMVGLGLAGSVVYLSAYAARGFAKNLKEESTVRVRAVANPYDQNKHTAKVIKDEYASRQSLFSARNAVQSTVVRGETDALGGDIDVPSALSDQDQGNVGQQVDDTTSTALNEFAFVPARKCATPDSSTSSIDELEHGQIVPPVVSFPDIDPVASVNTGRAASSFFSGSRAGSRDCFADDTAGAMQLPRQPSGDHFFDPSPTGSM